MVMHWTSDEDVRLLLNILKIHEIKLDYAALATATGPDVTAVAIKKHIQKLREKSEKGDVDPAGAGATSADGTTPKSSPKKGVKTPTKAAGLKVPTSGKKSSVKKGTKRNADDDAKESGDPQEGAVGEEEDVKVETMAKGKRIKLKNGQFQVDEDDEE